MWHEKYVATANAIFFNIKNLKLKKLKLKNVKIKKFEN